MQVSTLEIRQFESYTTCKDQAILSDFRNFQSSRSVDLTFV